MKKKMKLLKTYDKNIRKILILLIAIVCIGLAGCSKDNAGEIINGYTQSGDLKLEQVQLPEMGDLVAVISTNKGDIKLKLFNEIAPETVALFIEQAENGYYDGVSFDRIEKNFLIQIGENSDESNQIRTYLPDELNVNYRHITGAVGMSKIPETSDFIENRTTDLFYIITQDGIDIEYIDVMKEMGDEIFPSDVIEAYIKLGGIPRLDFSYNVFGQVYYGLNVVEEINQVPVNIATGEPDERIKIIGIEIKEYDGK